MLSRCLVLGFAVSFAMAPPVRAEDAVVPDAFEQQQQVAEPCDAYGAGFARLPGTNTCVKVSGKLRLEQRFSNRSSSGRGQTTLDFETRSD